MLPTAYVVSISYITSLRLRVLMDVLHVINKLKLDRRDENASF